MKIYGLVDPISNKIRYIGFTSYPLQRRLSKHISESKNARLKTHKARWIRTLLVKKLKPTIVPLLETTRDKCCQDEKSTIKEFLSKGFDLVNQTHGGEGMVSREGLLIASEKRKVSTNNYEHLRKYQIPLDDAAKERLRVGRINNPDAVTEGYRKLSAIRKIQYSGVGNPFYGKSHTDDSCLKISISKKTIPDFKIEKVFELRQSGLSLSKIGRVVDLPFQTVSKIVNKKFKYLQERK